MAHFLVSLDILDTGFLTVDSTSRVASASMVNSGNELRLKGVTLNLNCTANLDTAVTPDNHDIFKDNGAEKHALISINPINVTITIFVGTENISASNPLGVNDMSLLPSLLKLPQTRGLKAIYYPVAGDFRQRSSQLVYQLGSNSVLAAQDDINITLASSETASSSGYDLTDVNYLLVRFTSCEMTQTPSSNIKVTLSGVISR